MKTAEEWLEEMFGRNNWITADSVTIKQIQLDAMREGMRRAAEIVVTDEATSYSVIKSHILSAAEQLTEKDI